ncbi:uncharacterized protein G2W53_028290 [Senna tora]|uniref:Retrotransposon Copia-like N-terminal domain-containing protein n=1 Tax=Senna tora TaxID=362788 RepID=A0A834SJD0_9FABA|nr:uncharacterized protein G2W53_043798 [Senna tora]KAF7814321.1 uncharacterized protein G2W53_028290 [Senna tora]
MTEGETRTIGNTSTQPQKNAIWTLSNSDQPGMVLVVSPLIGSNYIAWSTAFRTALEAKQKIRFIDGTIKEPTDPEEHEKWKPIDSMVKSWIGNSISKEISESLVHCGSALALWKELEERFGSSCGPQLYHVQREMLTTEQGSDTITKYWSRLHRWWDEWTRISPSPRCYCGKCTCEVNKRLDEKESSGRLMHFLMGLSQNFDSFRGQILNLDPMPTANKAYNMALQLERQREVNMTYGGSVSGTSPSEGLEMAMVVKGGKIEGARRRETKEEKYSKYCEHCHMNGHLKESCFKLQGYPEWYKELKKKTGGNKKGQNVVASVGESPLDVADSSSNEQGNQMSILSMLVKELSKAMKGNNSEHVNFAQLGNFAEPLQIYLPNGDSVKVTQTGTVQKTDRILARGKVKGNLYILDCVGPSEESSLRQKCVFTGATYFVTIVDDLSRATWVFLIQHKNMETTRNDEFTMQPDHTMNQEDPPVHETPENDENQNMEPENVADINELEEEGDEREVMPQQQIVPY